jgi:hypothetical protein
MTDQERAMRMAIDQLRELRRANEILAARVDTMDLMATFVLARPPERRAQGMGEDAAWLLERELDRMRPKQPATAAELAAILNAEDNHPITINRDGSIGVNSATGGLAGDNSALKSTT